MADNKDIKKSATEETKKKEMLRKAGIVSEKIINFINELNNENIS